MFGGDSSALVALGERAGRAAAAGESTFAIPELLSVAATIASDGRAGALAESATGWLARGAGYHALVRLAAEYVLALTASCPAGESVYVPKASGELEPLLALWPDVLALPIVEPISARVLVAMRALPVHPLGVVRESAWADGRLCAPAEFFFHDVDHARFKVREDLRVLGVEISDPYRDGTTYDPALERHRVILSEAAGRIGRALWDCAPARARLAHELLARIDQLPDRALAETAFLLLFELVHEKSFPVERATLRRELATDVHLLKLQHKFAHGFFDPGAPLPGSPGHLDDARRWLLELI